MTDKQNSDKQDPRDNDKPNFPKPAARNLMVDFEEDEMDQAVQATIRCISNVLSFIANSLSLFATLQQKGLFANAVLLPILPHPTRFDLITTTEQDTLIHITPNNIPLPNPWRNPEQNPNRYQALLNTRHPVLERLIKFPLFMDIGERYEEIPQSQEFPESSFERVLLDAAPETPLNRRNLPPTPPRPTKRSKAETEELERARAEGYNDTQPAAPNILFFDNGDAEINGQRFAAEDLRTPGGNDLEQRFTPLPVLNLDEEPLDHFLPPHTPVNNYLHQDGEPLDHFLPPHTPVNNYLHQDFDFEQDRPDETPIDPMMTPVDQIMPPADPNVRPHSPNHIDYYPETDEEEDAAIEAALLQAMMGPPIAPPFLFLQEEEPSTNNYITDSDDGSDTEITGNNHIEGADQ